MSATVGTAVTGLGMFGAGMLFNAMQNGYDPDPHHQVYGSALNVVGGLALVAAGTVVARQPLARGPVALTSLGAGLGVSGAITATQGYMELS